MITKFQDLDVIDARQAKHYTDRTKEMGLTQSRVQIFYQIKSAIGNGHNAVWLPDYYHVTDVDRDYFRDLGYEVSVEIELRGPAPGVPQMIDGPPPREECTVIRWST